MFSAPPKDRGRRDRRRSGGVPAVLRRAGPLHRGRRDPIRPVDDHRRAGLPASGAGFPDRDALPLRPGHPAGRRQADAPGPRRPGRRRLAHLRLRRPAPTRPARRSRARQLCEFLASEASPISRFTPAGAEPDSVIDVRAIFQQGHRDLAVDQMPAVLLPTKGRFGLIDYEKTFCPDPAAGDIFDLRGIEPRSGLRGRRPPGPVRRARAAAGRARGARRLLRRDPDRREVSIATALSLRSASAEADHGW